MNNPPLNKAIPSDAPGLGVRLISPRRCIADSWVTSCRPKKRLSRSLAHFQGTSSTKVRRTDLEIVLHVFKSLSWTLCDWGYILLNHCKKNPYQAAAFWCLPSSHLSQSKSVCCLPLCHSHWAGSKSWGWAPSPSLLLFLTLTPFCIEICVLLSIKAAEQHRALTGCCYSGKFRGLRGEGGCSGGLMVDSSGGCKSWERGLSSGPLPKSPPSHTPCKWLLEGPEPIHFSVGKTPWNPYGISVPQLF